jgi:Domain of unknown function (DUF4342)
MEDRTEATLSILAAMFVIFVAMPDPWISAGAGGPVSGGVERLQIRPQPWCEAKVAVMRRRIMQERSRIETIKVEDGQLIDRVKQLIHEGNVRRVIIKQGQHTVVEFPLTVGVVGALLAPMLAALGAVAALITECTIEVERGEVTPTTNGQSAMPVPTEEIKIVQEP